MSTEVDRTENSQYQQDVERSGPDMLLVGMCDGSEALGNSLRLISACRFCFWVTKIYAGSLQHS